MLAHELSAELQQQCSDGPEKYALGKCVLSRRSGFMNGGFNVGETDRDRGMAIIHTCSFFWGGYAGISLL